jgi:nitrogen fixation NifU-like protein
MSPAPGAELDELYKDLILDHYRRPRNRRAVAEPKIVGEGYNPTCGDEIAVEAHFEGDVLADIGFEGRGCSLSQASGSMMTEAVKGKTVGEAAALMEVFTHMMRDPGFHPDDDLGDLEAFSGVAKYPVRVKCVTLAWHALRDLLNQRDGSRGTN